MSAINQNPTRARSYGFPQKRQRSESRDDTEDDKPVIPGPILKLIHGHARKFASLSCAQKNIGLKAEELAADLERGTTPKHLEYKFKKLYSDPAELPLRVALIKQAIEAEISALTTKSAEMKNLYDSRHESLKEEIQAVLTECEIQLDGDELRTYLDSQIQEIKIGFLLKQQRDQALKAKKREKFLESTEANAQPATLTVKEATALKSSVAALTKKVQKLSVKPKQGKGKGGGRKSPQPSPKPAGKSTGNGKRRNGNKRGSAKNNKSRGKNGKQ